jgi:DNA-directed RNA polymerase specialized sigma24 family protein
MRESDYNQLFDAAKKGDSAAYGEIVMDHLAPKLHRRAVTMGINNPDDVVAETIHRLVKLDLDTITDLAHLRRTALIILKKSNTDAFRYITAEKRGGKETLQPTYDMETMLSNPGGAANNIERRELCDRIVSRISRTHGSSDQIRSIIGDLEDGYSQSEIARRMGIPERTLRSRIAAIRNETEEMLKEDGAQPITPKPRSR